MDEDDGNLEVFPGRYRSRLEMVDSIYKGHVYMSVHYDDDGPHMGIQLTAKEAHRLGMKLMLRANKVMAEAKDAT